jgi:chemotaxis protein MotB
VPRKKHAAHENHERWLVSYADFITLLFAFFVVMFATSQTDRGKAHQLQESVKRAIEDDKIASAITGILGGVVDDKGKGNAQMRGPGGAERLTSPKRTEGKFAELLPSMSYLTRELQQQIKEGKMQVSMEARGLVVSFQQATFFPSGDDAIPEESYTSIATVAEVLRGVPNPIKLEGHTDSVPLVNSAQFRTNWELSAARAIAMMEVLVECCQVPRERFSISGFADNAPVASNDTGQGRMRNRRVDIVVLNQLGAAMEPESPTH